MSKRLEKKIRNVEAGIEDQLAREYESMSKYGKGMQREGYEGGYLQALRDVAASINGYVDCNSRHADLWRAA